MSEKHGARSDDLFCIGRRQFLLAGGTTVILSTLPGMAAAVKLTAKDYPRTNITSISALQQDVPVDFQYPPNIPNSYFFVVKLGEEAGGGIGPGKDIVAFSNFCPHMGGPLNGS